MFANRIPFFAALALTLTATTAFAQRGVRGFVDRQLDNMENRNNALEEAMNEGLSGRGRGNTAPPAVAAEVKSGWITRKSRDGKDVRLFFATPAGMSAQKPAAGLLVLQEWWGVNDDIQTRTKEFAARGFYAVAPDLYYGKTTEDPAEAAKLKTAMTNAVALTAMKTGLDLLEEESRNNLVNAQKIGAVGWCMGGEQALLLSVADPRVKATAIFYGPLVTDAPTLRRLQGPVLGIFGKTDTTPAPADVAKFKAALTAAGKTDVTIHEYEGVGHAFASKSAAKMNLYNEAKANEAWAELWKWLDAKLPR